MNAKGQTMLEALRDRLQADVNYYERMMYQASNEGRKDDECHHAGRKKEAESLLEFVGKTEWSSGVIQPLWALPVAELAAVMIGGDNPGLTNWIYKYASAGRCPRCGTEGFTLPCRTCEWKPSG